MDLEEVIDRAAAVISLLSVLGIALLLPLYLSQRRDLIRLRTWRENEPDFPRSSVETSESRLDSAEVELAKLVGTGETTPEGMLTAAARVTHERPALTRVTMEREALVPHPRWRRFLASVGRPRVLVPVGIVALLIAGGAIVLSEELLSGGDSRERDEGRQDRAWRGDRGGPQRDLDRRPRGNGGLRRRVVRLSARSGHEHHARLREDGRPLRRRAEGRGAEGRKGPRTRSRTRSSRSTARRACSPGTQTWS